jgi:hypothetical protein
MPLLKIEEPWLTHPRLRSTTRAKHDRLENGRVFEMSKLEDSLEDARAKLKSGLNDLKRVGAADPGQIIIAYNIECPQK